MWTVKALSRTFFTNSLTTKSTAPSDARSVCDSGRSSYSGGWRHV